MLTHINGKEDGNATAYDSPPAAAKEQANCYNDGKYQSILTKVTLNMVSDHGSCWLLLLDKDNIL